MEEVKSTCAGSTQKPI